MRMRKLILDLSLEQILSDKIKKKFLPKKLGFIDVLRTVRMLKTNFWRRTVHFDRIIEKLKRKMTNMFCLSLTIGRQKFIHIVHMYEVF